MSQRYSFDSSYGASYNPRITSPLPSPAAAPPLHSSTSSHGAPLHERDRRHSSDHQYPSGGPTGLQHSPSRSQPPPLAPNRSSSSSSNLFTRKLLKKNRTNSSTSTTSPPSASPLSSPNLSSSSSPPLVHSPRSYPQPSPHMSPYPYPPPTRVKHPSPYPPYHEPTAAPSGVDHYSSHRPSMTSTYSSHNSSQGVESEEAQLRRIEQESLEYEQQRLRDLEAEEERRLQQALEESSALAEQERYRNDEMERLRKMEEEIAVREALVYSREFEQAEAERIAREARKRTLEEEKEVQRTLARSRTFHLRGPREPMQEQREREALEAATRLSLDEDGRRWESEHSETASVHDPDDWSRRQSVVTTHETSTEDFPSSGPSYSNGQSRPPFGQPQLSHLTPQSSYIVGNPDRSSESCSESDEDGPPPSYSVMADEATPLDSTARASQSATLQPTTSSPSIDTTTYPTYVSPLPPSGAAPSRPHPEALLPYSSSTDNVTAYDTSPLMNQVQSLERADSTTASVGTYYHSNPIPSPLFQNIAIEDSIAEGRNEETEEAGDHGNPFDDQFAEPHEEASSTGHSLESHEPPAPQRSPSISGSVAPIPIVVETAPSQGSTSRPVSPESVHPTITLGSFPFEALSPAPAPIRRVSEPPLSVPTLLRAESTPVATSHSANTTPEPSPGLDSYPHSPSFGGIVEDTIPSSYATAQYVLDGMRWGFVSVERASMHPPLDSKGAFPRGAQLSSSKNDEGKQPFVSFAIEAKSWDALLVFLTWFGKSRFEASPHDHGVDETGQGHQVSVRAEFFRSFLDSSCRVRCRLELLPLAQSRPMSSATSSPNASVAETAPSFDSDCPTVHILLSHRPHLPLSLANLASLLANALAHSRLQLQAKTSSSLSAQQGCLAQAVDFTRRLTGETKDDYDDGNDSDDVGWTNKLKSRLRKKKVRVIKTETQQSADRRSVLPEGAMMITPFSTE
ncbi:hypothetical protein JCM16303_001612 [Sporobolomyces ruberrimus]